MPYYRLEVRLEDPDFDYYRYKRYYIQCSAVCEGYSIKDEDFTVILEPLESLEALEPLESVGKENIIPVKPDFLSRIKSLLDTRSSPDSHAYMAVSYITDALDPLTP